jgi:transcriptional regulator with XRE-family HTH domain
VGARIRALRQAAGLTQEDLAHRLGIPVPNVHRMESGRQNLTLRSLAKIAGALEAEVPALVTPQADAAHLPLGRKPPLRLQQLVGLGWTLTAKDAPLPAGAVPIVDVRARTGLPVVERQPAVVAWALPPIDLPLADDGLFLARVEGHAMAPRVPDGAWCLFRQPVAPPLLGKLVLLALDVAEAGMGYALRRVGAMEALDDGGLTVRFDPLDRDLPPLVRRARTDDDLRLCGELVEVLR